MKRGLLKSTLLLLVTVLVSGGPWLSATAATIFCPKPGAGE